MFVESGVFLSNCEDCLANLFRKKHRVDRGRAIIIVVRIKCTSGTLRYTLDVRNGDSSVYRMSIGEPVRLIAEVCSERRVRVERSCSKSFISSDAQGRRV